MYIQTYLVWACCHGKLLREHTVHRYPGFTCLHPLGREVTVAPGTQCFLSCQFDRGADKMDVDSGSPTVTETYSDAQTCTAGQGERSAVAAAEAQVTKMPNTNTDNTVEVVTSPPAGQEVPPQQTDAQAQVQAQPQDQDQDEAYLVEVDDFEDLDLWTDLQYLICSTGLLVDIMVFNDDEWFLAQMTRAVDAPNGPPSTRDL